MGGEGAHFILLTPVLFPAPVALTERAPSWRPSCRAYNIGKRLSICNNGGQHGPHRLHRVYYNMCALEAG